MIVNAIEKHWEFINEQISKTFRGEKTKVKIKHLSLKQRSEWMILDDQYFTFADLSKVYSVCELLKQ